MKELKIEEKSPAVPVYKRALLWCKVCCSHSQARLLPEKLASFMEARTVPCQGCQVIPAGCSLPVIRYGRGNPEPVWEFTLDYQLRRLPEGSDEPTQAGVGIDFTTLLHSYGMVVLKGKMEETFWSITVEDVTLSPWLSFAPTK